MLARIVEKILYLVTYLKALHSYCYYNVYGNVRAVSFFVYDLIALFFLLSHKHPKNISVIGEILKDSFNHIPAVNAHFER